MICQGVAWSTSQGRKGCIDFAQSAGRNVLLHSDPCTATWEVKHLTSLNERRDAEGAVAVLQAAEAALEGTQKTLQDSQGQLRDAERQLGDTAADLQSSEAPQALAFALLMARSLTAAILMKALSSKPSSSSTLCWLHVPGGSAGTLWCKLSSSSSASKAHPL